MSLKLRGVSFAYFLFILKGGKNLLLYITDGIVIFGGLISFCGLIYSFVKIKFTGMLGYLVAILVFAGVLILIEGIGAWGINAN